MTKKFILLISALIFSLLLGEIILRFFPLPDPYLHRKRVQNGYIRTQFPRHFQRIFSAEEGLPGFANYKKQTRFSINNYGFRGPDLMAEKKIGEKRIFVLGGSTTECLFLDDEDDWPALVQKKLEVHYDFPIVVQNCGRSGDSSPDHIAMLSHRIIHLDPDLLIVFMGFNDMRFLSCDDNLLRFDDVGKFKKIPLWKYVLSELQIFRRLYFLKKKGTVRYNEVITAKSNYRAKVERSKSVTIAKKLPEMDFKIWEEKIKILIGICAANEIDLIFMTQAATWTTDDPELKKWHWLTNFCGFQYQKSDLLKRLNEFNEIIVKVANSRQVPVFRTEQMVENTSAHFYDDCHFNYGGSRKVADKLSQFIIGGGVLEK